MYKVRMDLGLRHNIVEQFSSLWYKVAMRREIGVPGKHGMEAFMIDLKEAKKNV